MLKILVIENHAIVRAGINSLLTKEDGLEIIANAESGGEALKLLKDGLEPDVILTDLHLDDTCGIALAQKIREVYPAAKLIILTMETDERYLVQAFKAGVSGYVLKETDYDELIYGIKKIGQNKQFVCSGVLSRLSVRLTKEPEFKQRQKVPVDLSRREMEILVLLADGFTNTEIADKLFTSRRTVEGHRQSLLNKAGVRNTPELIKFAMINGLLDFSVAE